MQQPPGCEKKGAPHACDVCKTINLAKQIKIYPKPDMQMYEKCVPAKRIECGTYAELPVAPKCIKVCSKEEYLISKGRMKVLKPYVPYYVHGKVMWAFKIVLMYGAMHFTWSQGVWGDHHDVLQCWLRWKEYYKSFHSRKPPNFDSCGHIVVTPGNNNVFSPLYNMYKNLITQAFQGVVKLPVLMKCAYVQYLRDMQILAKEDLANRKLLRAGAKPP